MPTIKEAFTVAEVFAMMRAGTLRHDQGKAILAEIERKPWWQRVFGI